MIQEPPHLGSDAPWMTSLKKWCKSVKDEFARTAIKADNVTTYIRNGVISAKTKTTDHYFDVTFERSSDIWYMYFHGDDSFSYSDVFSLNGIIYNPATSALSLSGADTDYNYLIGLTNDGFALNEHDGYEMVKIKLDDSLWRPFSRADEHKNFIPFYEIGWRLINSVQTPYVVRDLRNTARETFYDGPFSTRTTFDGTDYCYHVKGGSVWINGVEHTLSNTSDIAIPSSQYVAVNITYTESTNTYSCSIGLDLGTADLTIQIALFSEPSIRQILFGNPHIIHIAGLKESLGIPDILDRLDALEA